MCLLFADGPKREINPYTPNFLMWSLSYGLLYIVYTHMLVYTHACIHVHILLCVYVYQIQDNLRVYVYIIYKEDVVWLRGIIIISL